MSSFLSLSGETSRLTLSSFSRVLVKPVRLTRVRIALPRDLEVDTEECRVHRFGVPRKTVEGVKLTMACFIDESSVSECVVCVNAACLVFLLCIFVLFFCIISVVSLSYGVGVA